MRNFEPILKDFVSRTEKEGVAIEGVAVADEKKVLFEHRFVPDKVRNIYSHTKSYTGAAIGIAIADGLLSLDDKPARFFPERLNEETADPRIWQITLKHLLTMSSGWGEFLLGSEDCRRGVGYPDYISYLFSKPMKYAPGEAFCYSSADSHLAGRMLAKAAGQRLQNFAYERLLRPMGLPYAEWKTDPEGHAQGGTGLRLTLIEMMRLGQVMLADGKWEGAQVVPAAWVKASSAMQIAVSPASDWAAGYGYQTWIPAIAGAYRMDGAYGQLTTVLPSAGLVVSVQCPEHGDFSAVRPRYTELLLALS